MEGILFIEMNEYIINRTIINQHRNAKIETSKPNETTDFFLLKKKKLRKQFLITDYWKIGRTTIIVVCIN